MNENFRAATPAVRIVGMVWYRREDYARLRKLFKDGHKLPATFDKWLEAAQKGKERFERDGHVVVKAYIDPDTFAGWCSTRFLNIDATARMQFANEAAFAAHGQQH